MPSDVWLVMPDAIKMDEPFEWTHCSTEQHVQIPLVPYITAAAPESALAFAFALGVRCALAIQRPVSRIHLAIGSPVEAMEGGETIRYYVGVGFLLSR